MTSPKTDSRAKQLLLWWPTLVVSSSLLFMFVLAIAGVISFPNETSLLELVVVSTFWIWLWKHSHSKLFSYSQTSNEELDYLPLARGSSPASNKTRKPVNAKHLKKRQPTFSERRASGPHSSFCGKKIKGGTLPKFGSIGRIKVRYDGSFPKHSGSRGKRKTIATNGNLQVFVEDPQLIENIDFEGKIVDIYLFQGP